MKKLLKFLLKTVLVLVALVVVLVLTLPLWLGPVVKPLAKTAVPPLTKTTFDLAHLSLNPYTGRLEIGGLAVGNPEGYDEPQALTLGTMVVDVDMSTLTKPCIHVEEVRVEDLFVSIVSGGENNVDNTLQIQYNIAGGKEKFEAAEAKKKAEKKAEAEKAEAQAETEVEESEAGPQIAIDLLVVKGIRVKYGAVTVPVPELTLRNLGGESKGMSLEELADTIVGAILQSANLIGDGVKAVGELGAKTLNAGTEVVNAGVQGATDAAGTVVDGATDAVKALGNGSVEGAKSAIDAAGKGLDKATDSIKGLGEGLKKLF